MDDVDRHDGQIDVLYHCKGTLMHEKVQGALSENTRYLFN
jgi:hypothetical protein